MSAIEHIRLIGELSGHMRFAVLLKGTLRGMGRRSECELLATKSVQPGITHATYSHCAVIEAPSDLPDGDYEVEFEGEVAVTRLQNACWHVARVMPRSYAEAATFFSNEARRVQARAGKSGEQRDPSSTRKERMNS
jgi:hypothetical protein